MITALKTILCLSAITVAAQAAAQVTLYESESFAGRNFTTNERIVNMERLGFNDRASSITVAGERWEVCDETRMNGRCSVLRPGRYPSLTAMGMDNRISSLRPVRNDERISDNRYAPLPVTASVTFYEKEGFSGRSFSTRESLANLEPSGFNNRVSSLDVAGASWKVCESAEYGGRCLVLPPGRYPSLAEMGMNNRISSVQELQAVAPVAPLPPAPVAASVTFFEREQFVGRSFKTQERIGNFERFGFNDRASSAEVVGASWQVCDDVQYGGRCVILPPGRYPSLSTMGLNNSISSAQDLRTGGAGPLVAYDARHRNNERLFEVPVTSVRAVVGPPEQRCWVEREQIPQEQRRSSTNVPAAIAGAVIGGILGHQVGDGRGRDLATIGGVVGGGLLGANVGRGSGQPATQDVQRCTNVQNQSPPALWDVTYTFAGQEHRVQMTMDPGPTVIVNERGEPRAKS